MTAARSSQDIVRNPLLALPSVQRLAALIDQQPAEVREAFNAVLSEISGDCRERGDNAWRKHKGPMAAYWKALGVYFRHFRLALRRPAPAESAS